MPQDDYHADEKGRKKSHPTMQGGGLCMPTVRTRSRDPMTLDSNSAHEPNRDQSGEENSNYQSAKYHVGSNLHGRAGVFDYIIDNPIEGSGRLETR